MALGCGGAKPNVVLVTIGSARADHIGCYGGDRVGTPSIDALSLQGVRFARAYTPVPLALPAHASILTGLYPMTHGVRDNATMILGDEQVTLAEVLQARGYATAAFIGSPLLESSFGLDQGFDLYDDTSVSRTGSLDRRSATEVNQAALRWLDDQAGRPFLLWVSYFDPHPPVQPPSPYNELFAQRPYDGEVAYADECLGILLERLQTLGLDQHTIVVVTADRGHSLGGHDEVAPLLAYNSTLHVPLLVRAPQVSAGGVVEVPVSTVDLAPTILELAGAGPLEKAHGRSLARALTGGAALSPLPLYAENLAPAYAFGWGGLRVLVDDGYRYIWGPRPELYSLDDSQEENDLAASHAQVAQQMQADLATFVQQQASSVVVERVPYDEARRRQLAALGYVAGVAATQVELAEALDPDALPPQDQGDVVAAYFQARQALAQGRARVALDGVLELLVFDPDNPALLELLVGAQLRLAWLDDARSTLEYLRQQCGHGPGTAWLTNLLAETCLGRGDAVMAEAVLGESLQAAPTAAGYYLYGEAQRVLGRRQRQLEALSSALDLDSAYVKARIERAVLHAESGAHELAEHDFKQAIRDDPFRARAHFNYGVFLTAGDRLDAALRHLGRAVELEPGHAQALHALVDVHVQLGRDDEARRWYDRLAARAADSPELEAAAKLVETSR